MPVSAIVASGTRFNRLVVVQEADRSPSGSRRFECLCDCGKVTIVHLTSLRSGATRSCGCYRNERIRAAILTHGHSPAGYRSPEYMAWATMKKRCYATSCAKYPRYGGRGIIVCEDWLHSFETFLKDMGPKPSAKHSIDRMDNNGNYCPANCRWATTKEQAYNVGHNRMITYRGDTRCFAEWSSTLGIAKSTLKNRLDLLGWSVEEAFETPVSRTPNRITKIRASHS